MIAAHALFDFPLQGDVVAENKNRNNKTSLQLSVNWWYWMASHCLSHGFAVAYLTGSWFLGFAETVTHFAIDFGKCENAYSIHVDQALHILCKIAWIVLFLQGF